MSQRCRRSAPWARRLTHAIVIFAFAAFIAGPRAARADSETHYADTIIGERAAGMAGAFTALADEATGAYYNPAGIAVDGTTLIQLSMSAYKLRMKRVRVLDLCGASLEDDRSAAFSFPASLGFVKLLRDGEVLHAFGLTLAVPYADRSGQGLVEREAECGPARVDIGVANTSVDRVLRGGLTYAVRPVPWLKLGATAGVTVRGTSLTFLLSALERSPDNPGTHPSISFSNIDVNLWSLFGQLGAIVELTPGWTAGLTVTTPYLPLRARGVLDLAQASGLPRDVEGTGIRLLSDAEYAWRVPLSAALGVAWTVPRSFVAAFDVKLHGPIDPHPIVSHASLSPMAVPHASRELVVNFALGGELWLSDQWIVRAGLFTNLSASPELGSMSGAEEELDLYGATLGVSWLSEDGSLLSLAFQGQWGTGERLLREVRFDEIAGGITAELQPGRAEEASLLVSFGGSFDLR